MARSKVPLLIVAGLFFALALYMLISAPMDEWADDDDAAHAAFAGGSGAKTGGMQHPCPYADILGLDENSVNPHEAGGHLPPLPAWAADAGIGAQPTRPPATAGSNAAPTASSAPPAPAVTTATAGSATAATDDSPKPTVVSSPPAAASSVGGNAAPMTTAAASGAAAAARSTATGAAPPVTPTESRPIAEDESAIRAAASANGVAASIKDEL